MTYGPLEFFYDNSFIDYERIKDPFEKGEVVRFKNGNYATIINIEYEKSIIDIGSSRFYFDNYYCTVRMHKTNKIISRYDHAFKNMRIEKKKNYGNIRRKIQKS